MLDDRFDLAECRSCGSPIIWTVTRTGKRMPVDADPADVPGGFRLRPEGDTVHAAFTADPGAGELLYVSHFSTCPDADQHRR